MAHMLLAAQLAAVSDVFPATLFDKQLVVQRPVWGETVQYGSAAHCADCE
jgi:hypothetical protein